MLITGNNLLLGLICKFTRYFTRKLSEFQTLIDRYGHVKKTVATSYSGRKRFTTEPEAYTIIARAGRVLVRRVAFRTSQESHHQRFQVSSAPGSCWQTAESPIYPRPHPCQELLLEKYGFFFSLSSLQIIHNCLTLRDSSWNLAGMEAWAM